MTDIESLRDRLVGQRFYDTEQDEAFTVVGVTSPPALALLQYDDGVPWDEGASNFTVDEEVSHRMRLDEHGLDSDRYRQLGPGPRIDQICDVEEHEWHPWPDEVWPNGIPDEMWTEIPGHPRTFYSRFARCKRCGLSGEVAGEFGDYGSRGHHQAPWFCHECGDACAGHELVYRRDVAHCPDCAAEIDNE